MRQVLHLFLAAWAVAIAIAAPTVGQGTSGRLPDPLGWRRLEGMLDRHVEPPLTVERQEIAAALARDAGERYRAVRDAEIDRFLVTTDELLSLRRAPDRAAIREAFARQSGLVARIEAIDAELFAGIEATLDEAQRAAFARVRREREREVLVATMPLGRDPGLRRGIGPYLGSIGATPEEIARIRALVDANEPALNDRLRAVRDRTRELFVAAGAAFEAEVGVLPPIGAAIDPEELDRIRSAITSRVAREIDETVAAIRELRRVQDRTLDAACATLSRERAALLRPLARLERLAPSVELLVDHGQVLVGKAASLFRASGGPIPIAGEDPIRSEEIDAALPSLVAWLEADRPWIEEFLALRDRRLPDEVAELSGSGVRALFDFGLSYRDLPEDRRAALLDRDARAVAELVRLETTLGERRFAALPPATGLVMARADGARIFMPEASMAWMRPAERAAERFLDPKHARRAAWSKGRSSGGRGGLVDPPDEAAEAPLREAVATLPNRPAIEEAFRRRTAALAAIEERIVALAAAEREWSRIAFGRERGPSDPDALLDRNRAERDAIFLAIAEADESVFASVRSAVEADRGVSPATRRAIALEVESARIDRAIEREIAANLGLNATFEFESRFASPVAAMREAGLAFPSPSTGERLLRATDLALADLRRLRGIAFREGGAADMLRSDFGDVEAARRRMERARAYSVARKRLVENWRSLLGTWTDAFPPVERDRFVSAYLRLAAPDLFTTADDPAPLLAAARRQPEVADDPDALATVGDLEAERSARWLPACEAIARQECLLEPRDGRALERLAWERAEATAQIVGRLRRAIGDETAEAIGLPEFSARLRGERLAGE